MKIASNESESTRKNSTNRLLRYIRYSYAYSWLLGIYISISYMKKNIWKQEVITNVKYILRDNHPLLSDWFCWKLTYVCSVRGLSLFLRFFISKDFRRFIYDSFCPLVKFLIAVVQLFEKKMVSIWRIGYEFLALISYCSQ